jgi:spore germination cell wall hydrolase CwlJ-like protein
LRVAVLVFLISLSLNTYAQSDQTCLAVALHKEASGESSRGKRAVLDTIFARVEDTSMTPCQVLRVKGQYSWVSRNTRWKASEEMLRELREVEQLDTALDIRYLWFFRKEIRPIWSRRMSCRVIGKHRFCRKVN